MKTFKENQNCHIMTVERDPELRPASMKGYDHITAEFI
tara:strand:- start:213 stop:326 length:114 start_codon:yes stop_codon:yes gene_type:complete